MAAARPARRARRPGLRLYGENWISNAPDADVYAVFARRTPMPAAPAG